MNAPLPQFRNGHGELLDVTYEPPASVEVIKPKRKPRTEPGDEE